MARFTFRTKKATGKWRSFQKDQHDISLSGKVCGTIDDDKPHKIRFMITKSDINEDDNPNCTWKWIMLKKQSETLQEARDFLSKHTEVIIETYNLRFMEE